MTSFPYPTQVIFTDDEGKHGGIAYRDEIICGCCGGVVPIDEASDIIPLPWVTMSDEIAGEPVELD